MLEIECNIPGERALQRRTLEFGQYTIGRAFGADIRLKHDSVAKRHALLTIDDEETLLHDVGAADSVRRNGVVFNNRAPVRRGDTFTIGDCEIRILEHLRESDTQRAEASANPTTSSAGNPPVATETASTAIDTVDAPFAAELRPLQERLQELVLRELDLFRRTALNSLGQADLRKEARLAIESIMASGAIQLPPSVDRTQFIQEMTAEIMGYGPIEPYLADESVSEVMVNGPNQIYIERRGRLTLVPARFINAESLMRVIERIVSPLGRRIDEGVPMVDARLPDGSRVNAIIPPLSLIGPILTIRKFAKQRFSMDRLVEIGSLTPQMATFLRICVEYRKNIIVSGGTGSGKTTFLNALSESIPASDRICTIEDAAELRLVQPHVLSLEARPPNVEGRGEVTIRDLVRNSLRMRPDRIIVGECRGGEALDMLQAMNTGHDGSLTTVHANTPRDALSRIETMIAMGATNLPERAMRQQIAAAIQIVIQQSRMSDGTRKVTSISEITGMEGEVITMQEIFCFEKIGVTQDGKVIGRFRATGVRPKVCERLKASGVHMPADMFEGVTEVR